MVDWNILDTKTPFATFPQRMAQESVYNTALMQNRNAQNVQSALYDLSQNPNPTSNDYMQMMKQYPQLSETLQAPMKAMNDQQKQSLNRNFAPIVAAVNNKRYDVAGGLLDDLASTLENSGDRESAQASRVLNKLIIEHPDTARTSINLMAAAYAPDVLKSMDAAGKSQLEQLKTGAEINKLNAEAMDLSSGLKQEQTRAGIAKTNAEIADIDRRAAIEQEKLRLSSGNNEFDQKQKIYQNQQVPDSLKPELNKAEQAAIMSGNTVGKADALIKQFEPYKDQTSFGSALDSLGRSLGRAVNMQTDFQEVVDEAKRLSNSEAVKSLPPGSASDADVATAKQGLPDISSHPARWISYLTGLKKMAALDQAYNSTASLWLQNNNGMLGAAQRDFTIDVPDFGTIGVKKGTNFSSAYRGYSDKVLKDLQTQRISAVDARARGDMPAQSNQPQDDSRYVNRASKLFGD